uniref:Inner centromere protein ARK-binding domain-containing protein n=1 Tax=Anopheles christyi TaxID=43041 RepID=A0A182K2T6_9DIPT
MDELLEMFNSFIGEALDHEKAMDAEFVELEKKLSECVTLAKERGTPVQNKKRPKRQASISEQEEERDTKNTGQEKLEAMTSSNDRSISGAARSSSARMLDVSDKGESEKLPQPMDTTTSVANESLIRPSRTARLKAQEKLKEPMLMGKLRNDGGVAVTIKIERNSTVANSTLVRGGKDAGVAMEKRTLERTYVEMETENDANQANRIIEPASDKRNDEGFSSATETSKREEANAPKSERDMSLLVIPPVVPKVEIVSDEEMPPPSMPPPKLPAPKVRTKKKPPVGGKTQKDTCDTASSSAVSSADSTMNSTASSVNSNTSSSSSGRPLRTKTKQAAKQAEEPVTKTPSVPMELGVVIEPIRIKAEKISIVQQQPPTSNRTSDKSTYEDAQEQQNQSQKDLESTAQLEHQMRPLKIALQKIPLHELPQYARANLLPADLNGTYTTSPPVPSDGTFVMPPSIQDGTFTVNSPMENAPGGARCNETFNIPAVSETPSEQQHACRPNDTFVIEKHGGSSGADGQRPLANASIMTEDDSVVENSPVQATLPHLPEQTKSKTTPRTRAAAAPPLPGPKPQKNVSAAVALKKSASVSAVTADAKKHKELFNPCVMSPIKSRIEAFEKCANTGTGTSKIGTPQAQIGRLLKTVSTPTLGTESHGLTRSAHAKPLASSSVYTPNCAAQPPVPKASSASKISQMQSRALQHGMTGGGQATRSQSRDSSWDRAGGGGGGSGGNGTLSAASSTSSLLDEKKKKREEKQRLAAAQREAMEREKREHAERLVREKEEKYKKLVQEKQEKLRLDAQKKARKQEEFEKRRQAEEQKTLADLKRDELAKQLADQERINRELQDTIKQNQAKDNHETKLHKQLYQQKLRQQQQQLEKQHHQQQLAAKKKQAASSKAFTFEMIDTDDSTDEEVAEDTSAPRKKQRPPLPEWSQKTADFRKQLQLQAQLQPNVIDRLFSVQPMTPDLRLLFPSIDAQKLKRNSSAIWRTPPRYSQLP